MSDQELTVQAISEAQHILEEYLEPRHHDNERLLDRLVEVLERPSVLVAVDRLRRGGAAIDPAPEYTCTSLETPLLSPIRRANETS
jgi:hypothetical protein